MRTIAGRRLSAATRWLTIAALAGVCSNPVAVTTGLTGTVSRGPITPVCQENVPCDAPFAATFEVRRGDHVVATFTSDAQGHFVVRLPPGSYVVVPAAGSGIMNAGAQGKSVEVGAEGLTTVQLVFDTGIR